MLVGARSEVISNLKSRSAIQNFDLAALFPVWRFICQRYWAEQFSTQTFLFESHDTGVRRAWDEYVYGELLPALVREGEVVRNVLRSIGGLPTESPEDSVIALFHFVNEMDLPSRRAPWAPEKDIE